MPEHLELCLGLAGEGKTDFLLERYRSALLSAQKQRHVGRTLWLAPTRLACREVERKLLSPPLTACGRPQIMTFDDFAERILSHAALSPAAKQVLAISNLERRWIVRRLLDRLYAAGELPHFAPVVKTSGFLDLVVDFIAELKREELWPEDFQKICRQRGERAADRELGFIYLEYQRALNEHHRYDAEGRFWLARTLVKQGVWSPFDNLQLVVADGFSDFTSTQHEILEELSKHAATIMISLPFTLDDKRRDLFSRAAATYQQLIGWKKRGVNITESTPVDRANKTVIPVRKFLAQHLFSNPRDHIFGNGAGIEIVETIGPYSELRFLTARIKQLIKSGIPPRDIVVAYRSLGESSEILQEMFTAASIPWETELTPNCDRDPWLKSLMSLLQLEVEDWPFERLHALLNSSFFRPRWTDWKPDESPHQISHQLRRRKLAGERSAILHTLAHAAERNRSQLAAPTPESFHATKDPDVQHVHGWLQKLSDVLAILRKPAPLAEWIDRLTQLVDELGFVPSNIEMEDVTDGDRQNVTTWEYVKRILYDLAQFETLVEQFDSSSGKKSRSKKKADPDAPDVAKLSLADFLQYLNDLMRSTPLPKMKGRVNGVRILSAQTARHLDIPYLLLVGMNEGSFPSPRRENCLYGEQERAKLRELGVPFSIMRMHQHDEMNLFYSVVTRASTSLVFCYSTVDAGGHPMYASPYVTALKGLCAPETLKLTHYGQLDPIPDRSEVLTPADLRIRATHDVYQHDAGLFQSMRGIPECSDVAETILASAHTAALRENQTIFSTHEGMIHTPQALAYLQNMYPPGREYSATELENYAICPFRFFVNSILDVQPLESPEPETDYRRRGIMVHQILSALLREAHNEEAPPAEWTTEALIERFRELVSQNFGQRVSDSRLQVSLNRIEQKLLEEWGSIYDQQWRKYVADFTEAWDAPPLPDALEVAFGAAPNETESELPPQHETQTRYPPLVIGEGQNALSLRGRIDRIDVGKNGEARVYNIIDYKTGAARRFSREDVISGTSLQLVIYALAVQRLGIVGPDARPYQMLFWSIKDKGYENGFRSKKGARRQDCAPLDKAVWQSLVVIIETRLPELVTQLRGGQFPVYNADENCTGFCDYRTVCRIHQIRSRGKIWHSPTASALETTPIPPASDSATEGASH
ncbi:MAG: PD-(D/E)XK nuclease family protein [Planctomycetaceae bacterium]